MANIKKVIEGLEQCISTDKTCFDCPYEGTTCTTTLNSDALALLQEQQEEIENLKQTCQSMIEGAYLLKEQEAVEPQTQSSAKGYWYTCGACGWWLFEVRDTVHFDDRKRIRFCASCGKAVKWE